MFETKFTTFKACFVAKQSSELLYQDNKEVVECSFVDKNNNLSTAVRRMMFKDRVVAIADGKISMNDPCLQAQTLEFYP